MKNTLRLDHAKKLVIMDKTFAKFAANTRSEEYAHLQQVRRDYPHYEVIQRTIKRNPNKECYHGLTYEFICQNVSQRKQRTSFTDIQHYVRFMAVLASSS